MDMIKMTSVVVIAAMASAVHARPVSSTGCVESPTSTGSDPSVALYRRTVGLNRIERSPCKTNIQPPGAVTYTGRWS